MLAILRAFEPASDGQRIVAPRGLKIARIFVVVTQLLLEYAVDCGKVAYLIITNALSSLSAPALKIRQPLVASKFFNTIPKITHFKGVVEEQNFYPAPDDWLIVIADICSSTEAIAAGRYKEVNLIGGAIICAIQNATGTRDWPFVFGGDGATVLIHPDVKISVQTALLKTRSMAKREFDLDLRIGIVPIDDMRKRGADVLVARHEVSPGNCLALFGGGGVELAEKLVKSTLTDGPYTVPERVELERPDLTGLSCRWEFVKNQNGKFSAC